MKHWRVQNTWTLDNEREVRIYEGDEWIASCPTWEIAEHIANAHNRSVDLLRKVMAPRGGSRMDGPLMEVG